MKLVEVFNYGTIPFYWGQYEPNEGEIHKEGPVNATKFLREKNIKVKGHPLCWHTACADWLMEYDNKTILDPDDDVVNKELGGNWRMPTKEEFDALVNNENCTSTWTTQNGVNGLWCTGKAGTAFAANSVFLPAAGYFDNRFGGNFYEQGTRGTYWSSTPVYNREDYAWVLNFHSKSQKVLDYGRGAGYSVRAVLNGVYAIE